MNTAIKPEHRNFPSIWMIDLAVEAHNEHDDVAVAYWTLALTELMEYQHGQGAAALATWKIENAIAVAAA